MLEYDDERSGTLAPLKDLADDKFVVLGLITTKRPTLENVEDLKQRISEARRYVPLERLGLSPQCGFSSSIIGNKITAEDQRRKLELAVKASHAIWGSA